MKKNTLLEEIKRIHEITYGGKTVVLENSIWDLFTGKKHDEKKADVVEPELDEFYKSLTAAAQSGLSQRQAGQMGYQKEVESMQIGLQLLGYELPRFGVDGKFGPETANTVRKFKQDNLQLNEEVENTNNVKDHDLDVTINTIISDFKKTNPGVKVKVTDSDTPGQSLNVSLSPYNQMTAGVFKKLLDKHIKAHNFSYTDFKEKSSAGGHFHIQYTGPEEMPINEVVEVVPDGGGIIGRPGQGTHNAGDWASGNAWDIKGPVGSDVHSITNGVVTKLRVAGGGIKRSGVKVIFGDQLTIKSNDGKPDVFYTHIKATVSVGQQVKEGDVVGTIIAMGGIPSHVHIGLSDGSIKDLASGIEGNPGNGRPGGGTGSAGGSDQPMEQATPEMLTKMIEMLKAKGIKAADINKYTNVVAGIENMNYTGGTDNDFYKAILTGIGAPVTPENLKFLYAWRQSEGKAANFNPFNTTWKMEGSVPMNSAGVQVYKSAQDGLNATIKTLSKPAYNCITNGLRQNIGADKIAACSQALHTWGTGDLVAKVVASYNQGASPKISTIMA